jgi:RNA polymerase sigma factor (sigma-70 family)
LQGAESFDPERSAVAWIIGISLRILQEKRRGQARRPVIQSELGDAAWQKALDQLCAGDDTEAATLRLDLRQALNRLEAEQRRVVELRYFKGLDGEELAHELGAPTAGAARVRLARALQALRGQFGLTGSEEET